MKIGFFVTHIASAPNFENVVSAHVQLPLYTIKLLSDEGHTVQLIVTEFGKDRSLPNCLPGNITIHKVVDGRRRGNGLVMDVGLKKGIHLHTFIKQLIQMKKIIEEEKYDIMHFFGSNRMAYLAGLMHFCGLKVPIVLTINNGEMPERYWFLTKYLWRKVLLIITSTEFLRNKFAAQGIRSVVLRHGIVRNLEDERRDVSLTPPHRVLFWRDPSKENGADVCLEIYKKLAPKFPDISFDLALRPHWDPVEGITELNESYPNINIYRFPYEHGISLSKLIAESICIFLPFRELSTHPQFSVMESMMSGVAVVTTALDSNIELITSGKNGFLVPVGDIEETSEKIEELILNRKKTLQFGINAAKDVRAKWNWDMYISNLIKMYEEIIE